jgi:hypothetical protein
MRMKLTEAIKIIEEREKMPYKAAKDMQKTVVVVGQTNEMKKNIVPVKTYLLQEDIIALKKKTRESSIMGAISKAVDYYLKFGDDE